MINLIKQGETEIVESFYLTKDIEKYGSGFIRVGEEIAKYPTMKFKYQEMGNGFLVTISYEQQKTNSLVTTPQATPQDYEKILLDFCSEAKSIKEMIEKLGLKDRKHFRQNILNPLLEKGLLKQTIPDKPKSPKQKYIKG